MTLSPTISKAFLNQALKPRTTVLSNHLLTYPTPANLSYNWSFGSLVGLFFARQIVSGIFLARHYTPHVDLAFSSVEHIRTDVFGGSVIRYFHANGGSAIFILRYLHRGRNLYYQSYASRSTLWYSGLVIFLRRRATAFIGYVLPWGQRSFWGATVITSLVTAVPFVGLDIAHWVWGGYSIDNATLTRFFSLHYLLPFLITGLVARHLSLLHAVGSSDPLNLAVAPDKLNFHPYFTIKDSFILVFVLSLFGILLYYVPNQLGHADNFLPANPLVTPAHIVPEWYFTPFYAILRACPNKAGGALGRFGAIIRLFTLPSLVNKNSRNTFAAHTTTHKTFFWAFVAIFLRLGFLGSRAAAEPYVTRSKITSVFYFSYFVVISVGARRRATAHESCPPETILYRVSLFVFLTLSFCVGGFNTITLIFFTVGGLRRFVHLTIKRFVYFSPQNAAFYLNLLKDYINFVRRNKGIFFGFKPNAEAAAWVKNFSPQYRPPLQFFVENPRLCGTVFGLLIFFTFRLFIYFLERKSAKKA